VLLCDIEAVVDIMSDDGRVNKQRAGKAREKHGKRAEKLQGMPSDDFRSEFS